MSLVLTRIQNIRSNSNLDKYEYRPSRYGALDAFIQQSNDPTGILTPELKEKARTSIGNILETPVYLFIGFLGPLFDFAVKHFKEHIVLYPTFAFKNSTGLPQISHFGLSLGELIFRINKS